MNWIAGIDIGGTNLKAVAVSPAGDVLHRVVRATNSAQTEQRETWVAGVRAVLAELTAHCGPAPMAAGIGAPGLAALDGRSIAHLPGKLEGLAGIDWTDVLGAFTHVPVLNDAQAALLGEVWLGAARGRRHVVMLTLGTGIGGAVLLDGQLLRGAIGRAGHLGHMSLDPDGPVSITGMPGALEVFTGDYTVPVRTHGKFQNTAELVAAYVAGDSVAAGAWLRTVRFLGCGIASCINLFDPEVIVLGGGIAQAGDALFGPLARELDRCEWRPAGHRVPLVPAELRDWAGALGAAYEAKRRVA